MPELPEVETIKNQLIPILPFKIDKVYFSPLTNRLVKKIDFNIQNFSIIRIRRHGKWMIFDLQPFGHILSHLGMSGSWRTSNAPLQDKHGHIEFIDTSKQTNGVLTYVDPRRFGHFYLLNEENFNKIEETLPIDVSSLAFDESHIAELFFKYPHKVLKPFLLDQKTFPGVGNYMASEICARAGILPTRITGDVSAEEIRLMKNAIEIVVSGALKTNGTTFSGGYRDANGDKGEGVRHLVVFHQNYCQMCKEKNKLTKVIKTVLAGRGTYHCPHCQR
jgi:formamidopyrimidine-DNA glycosylase